jgi:hypothetical protein
MPRASSSDPLRLAAESLERFLGRRRGRILYALGLHADGSVTLTVFDRDGAASARLSGLMVDQLIGQLRGRKPGEVRQVLSGEEN